MGHQGVRFVQVNKYERNAIKIKTENNTFWAKSCPVCGQVLANPDWKVCKSCYEWLKGQKNQEHKKENKH